MDEDTRAIILSLRDRQNTFEETTAGFFQEMAAIRHDMQIAAAKSDARWADTQADIKELQFENQRILKWLENQQRST
jgi:peptidyl-tRNA hydrolase